MGREQKGNLQVISNYVGFLSHGNHSLSHLGSCFTVPFFSLVRCVNAQTTIDMDENLWKKFSVLVVEEGYRKKKEIIEELIKGAHFVLH